MNEMKTVFNHIFWKPEFNFTKHIDYWWTEKYACPKPKDDIVQKYKTMSYKNKENKKTL